MTGSQRRLETRRTHALSMVVLISSLLWAPVGVSQSLSPYTEHATDPLARHQFVLNPASSLPKGRQLDSLFTRTTKTVSEEDSVAGTAADELKGKVSEDAYGAAFAADLGGGLAVGLKMERQFRVGTYTSTNSTREQKEYFGASTYTGRLAVELIPGLTAGFLLQYVMEHVTLAGSFNTAESERPIYDASLTGYGGGVSWTNKIVTFAGAYVPPVTGKATISEEQRIVIEPGKMNLGATWTLANKLDLGIGFIRHIHQRDDRAATVTMPSGTNVNLSGLDPDTTLFPIQAYTIGANLPLTSALSLRGSAFYGYEVFIFNAEDIPKDTTSGEIMKTPRLRLGAALLQGALEVQAGLATYSRKHTFSRQFGGQDREYKATASEMYLIVGGQF